MRGQTCNATNQTARTYRALCRVDALLAGPAVEYAAPKVTPLSSPLSSRLLLLPTSLHNSVTVSLFSLSCLSLLLLFLSTLSLPAFVKEA